MEQVYGFDELTMPLWIKILYWGFYMVVFVFAVRKLLLVAPKDKREVDVDVWIVLYFTLYAMFYCVNPDYFSYRDWLKVPNFSYWNREQVYAYLILFGRFLDIDYQYELFRLIVWGGGLLLVWLTAKLYNGLPMPGLVMTFLFVLFSGTFCYGRVSLGMAVFFMGVTIMMMNKPNLVRFLGFVLVLSSYFFHHQMIIGIGMLPGMILHLEKKKNLVFAMILLGMMIAVISYINSNISLMEEVFGADELAEKMETYNERGSGTFRLSTSVAYINIILPFVFTAIFFFNHKRKKLPRPIVGIFRITFLLLLATVAFFVVSGPRSTYTYRVLYLNIVPVSILVSYCYNEGYFKDYQLALMFLMALVTNSLRLISSVQQ